MLVLQNILWLLVLIGVMIMIHELGHFWAARYFDVKVETFSFGFGPRLFGFRRGETDYRFSAILFGGYVKMAGEQPGDENADDPRSFLCQTALAAADHRLRRSVHERGAGGRPVDRPVHGQVPEAGRRRPAGRDRPRGARFAGGQGRHSGRATASSGSTDKNNPTWEDVGLKEIASADRPLDVTVERGGKRFETSRYAGAGRAQRGGVRRLGRAQAKCR